jgi:hypothetical protein
METITEVLRLPSPAPRPQALALDGATLWMGSIETETIYAIDHAHWTAREETRAPGKPWGMTLVGDELRVICGEPPDDHRRIRTLVPGHGFASSSYVPCPDDTGSHLAFDGDVLYVSQWYNRRILALDAAGAVGTTIAVPHQICGMTVYEGVFYCLTTEDESTLDYWITRVDARGGEPLATDLARVPFHARALAFDGLRFWTNHREANEIVAFTVPE